MPVRQQTFVALARIALAALLMAALMPTISHLLAGRQISVSPACHVASNWATAAGHSTTVHATFMDDCAYCSMAMDLPALPPLPAGLLGLMVLTSFAAPSFFSSPRPVFIWLSAQSRAPPTH